MLCKRFGEKRSDLKQKKILKKAFWAVSMFELLSKDVYLPDQSPLVWSD